MDEKIRELCRRASIEQDSDKLMELTKEISELLEQQERERNGKATSQG